MYWYAGKLIDRRTIEIDIDEPALLYGASAFTTLRVDRLEPEVYRLHCDRLRQTSERFDWVQPDWERIDRGVLALAPEFAVLRIAIFPNGYELITGRILPPQLAIWQRSGVAVTIADREFCRSLPHYKTGNYLAPWLALKQARDSAEPTLRERNIQEAILTNDRGDWLETTTGNLWGYRDGNWYTPPLNAGILPGIARAQIVARLRQQGKQAIEIDWNAEWVKDLESIGYSNSVVGFIPIHTVITNLGNLRYTVDLLRRSGIGAMNFTGNHFDNLV